MKLKLDLHAIYNDTSQIEAALQGIIAEAVQKRVAEVEIIPGKGSGALKKTVLRFLDRPEIKRRYHRIEKDGDNWGRLFVHFRPERGLGTGQSSKVDASREIPNFTCFCCRAAVTAPDDVERIDCPACGSPNRLVRRMDRAGRLYINAESGYVL